MPLNLPSRASWQTMQANLAQQACAVVLFLALPNMMARADYAQIVFVGVLLSFIGLADLGLSLVYGRVVPALSGRQSHDEVRGWDSTVLGFGLITAALFSGLVAAVYGARFRDPVNAVLLLFVPVLLFWVSFHVTRASAMGEFAEYRRALVLRSSGSMLAIPLVALSGLAGWFAGQLLSALLVMVVVGRQLLRPLGRIRWALVRNNLSEALALSAVNVAWLQLLNYGRLYASLRYPADDIAHYGVAGAANQSLAAFVISIFLPVTVGIYRQFGGDETEAFRYAEKSMSALLWWVALGTAAAVCVAPAVLEWVFPAYRFSGWMLFGLLAGVMLYPVFIVLGGCLIAKKRALAYLALIVASAGLGTLAAVCADRSHAGLGAAWGQLAGLTAFTLGLIATIRVSFGPNAAGLCRYALRSFSAITAIALGLGAVVYSESHL